MKMERFSSVIGKAGDAGIESQEGCVFLTILPSGCF
jgi:hypothetical protein